MRGIMYCQNYKPLLEMRYYKSCDDLPLKIFFKIVETGNLKHLVISNSYDFIVKKDLPGLWESILMQYAEISGDTEILTKFESFKELYQLIATYDIINAMIYTLYYRYNQQYINDLQMFGYIVRIKDNCIDIDSLENCTQMSRSILNDIEKLKLSLFEAEEKEDYKNIFYKTMAWLIKGYGNLEENITVSKYVALRNHLRQLMRKQNG